MTREEELEFHILDRVTFEGIPYLDDREALVPGRTPFTKEEIEDAVWVARHMGHFRETTIASEESEGGNRNRRVVYQRTAKGLARHKELQLLADKQIGQNRRDSVST